MPLNPVDTDARWRSSPTGKASGLQYQENVIVHLGGFILSRGDLCLRAGVKSGSRFA